MKKKMTYLVVIVIVLFICIITFFKPLSLLDNVSEKNQIKIVLNEFGIKNGEPYIDSHDYQNITDKQRSDILEVFEKYSYKRTFNTLFSDDSVSSLGDKTLSIYIYDNMSLVTSIFVSSSGTMTMNEKTYRLNDADKFIDQIIKIVE